MTALVPKNGENFKSTFLYQDGFKANYILNKPTSITVSYTHLTPADELLCVDLGGRRIIK